MSRTRKEKIIASRQIYSAGKSFSIEEVTVSLAPGKTVKWKVIRVTDSVALVPMDSRGNVYLVEEYFAATDERALCLPKGKIDEGESPRRAALRELAEEAGFTGKLRKLSVMTTAPGYLSHKTTVFLATNLRSRKLTGDEEHHLKVVRMPLCEAIRKVKAGKISEARTVAALLLADSATKK